MLESKSYIATPPGVTIKEQLDDYGMTQKEFARRMGLSEKHVSQLINGTVRLTPDVAERLELVLGIPARFWNTLEAIYQEKLIKAKRENELEKEIEIAKKYPYKSIAEWGMVADTTKSEEKVKNLCKYFGVHTLEKVHMFMPIACRRLAETEKSTYATWTLAQYAKHKAGEIEVETFSRNKLVNALPEIRKMTLYRSTAFAKQLEAVLAQCGVALVYLPRLQGSFLHGITFYDDNKNKIVLGVTMRGKYADKFWFSLFHEIAHILEGHIYRSRDVSEEEEKQADVIAANILIPEDKMQQFIGRGDYSIASIAQFAETIGVQQGIVIGRLQNDKQLDYRQFNQYKVKYDSIV